jgi:hypothetical protein
MMFVALLKGRPGTMQERTARRAEWEVPDVGAELIAEYWLQTPDPAVVSVFKADHIGQMWAAFGEWDDYFDVSIYPAIEAQEGLELLKQMYSP